MKKNLIIMYDYYPSPSANTICMKFIIDTFLGQNESVIVVCVKPNLKLSKHEIIDGVSVYRITNYYDLVFRNARRIFYSSEVGFLKLIGKTFLKNLQLICFNKIEGYVSGWGLKELLD